jgi:large subunit ribosomal protein L13
MAKLINGEDLIVGRVASYVAKNLLKDEEEVYIYNAEKMVFSGNMKPLLAKYVMRRAIKNKANPEHSPHWPKRPDFLVKRIIRGMLPYDKPRGKTLYKKIKVFIGDEEKLNGVKVEFNASYNKAKLDRYVTVKQLSKALAYDI